MPIELYGANRCSVLVVYDDQVISKLSRHNLEDEGIQIVETTISVSDDARGVIDNQVPWIYYW